MKKLKKRIIALVLTLVILVPTLCMSVFAYEVPNDLKGHWSEREVYTLITEDIISGYPDGTFRPDDSISRAEFCKIVIETLVKYELVSYATQTDTFSDVPKSEWFSKYVETAYEYGIVDGVGDGKFEPNSPVTREQLAKILANVYCQLFGESLSDISKPEITSSTFSDYNKISSWALPYVSAVYNTGLMKGSEGNFYPAKPTTRAEAGTAIFRLFDFSYVGLLRVDDFVYRFNYLLKELGYSDSIADIQWNKDLNCYEFISQNGTSFTSSRTDNINEDFDFRLLFETVKINGNEYIDHINVFYTPKNNYENSLPNYIELYAMFTFANFPDITEEKLIKTIELLEIFNSFGNPEEGHNSLINHDKSTVYTDERINYSYDFHYIATPPRSEKIPYGTNMFVIDYNLK